MRWRLVCNVWTPASYSEHLHFRSTQRRTTWTLSRTDVQLVPRPHPPPNLRWRMLSLLGLQQTTPPGFHQTGLSTAGDRGRWGLRLVRLRHTHSCLSLWAQKGRQTHQSKPKLRQTRRWCEILSECLSWTDPPVQLIKHWKVQKAPSSNSKICSYLI